MSRVVLQKLLSVDYSEAIVQRGFDQVGGIVVQAGDAAGLVTPDALLAAYGFGQSAVSVDVIRFELPVCATLGPPTDVAERPWPTYPNGFLRPVQDSLVPVWELSWTRLSAGAELWRIFPDQPQQLLSVYRGAVWGWAGARQWRPASPLLGSRARWQGAEYTADVTGDRVDLTSFTDPGAGWEQRRPATWSRVVPRAECEIFEMVCSAVWSGRPVRVLDSRNGLAQVLLKDPDPAPRWLSAPP